MAISRLWSNLKMFSGGYAVTALFLIRYAQGQATNDTSTDTTAITASYTSDTLTAANNTTIAAYTSTITMMVDSENLTSMNSTSMGSTLFSLCINLTGGECFLVGILVPFAIALLLIGIATCLFYLSIRKKGVKESSTSLEEPEDEIKPLYSVVNKDRSKKDNKNESTTSNSGTENLSFKMEDTDTAGPAYSVVDKKKKSETERVTDSRANYEEIDFSRPNGGAENLEKEMEAIEMIDNVIYSGKKIAESSNTGKMLATDSKTNGVEDTPFEREMEGEEETANQAPIAFQTFKSEEIEEKESSESNDTDSTKPRSQNRPRYENVEISESSDEANKFRVNMMKEGDQSEGGGQDSISNPVEEKGAESQENNNATYANLEVAMQV